MDDTEKNELKGLLKELIKEEEAAAPIQTNGWGAGKTVGTGITSTIAAVVAAVGLIYQQNGDESAAIAAMEARITNAENSINSLSTGISAEANMIHETAGTVRAISSDIEEVKEDIRDLRALFIDFLNKSNKGSYLPYLNDDNLGG